MERQDTLLLDRLPLPAVDFCLGMGAGGCTPTACLGGSQHTLSKFSPVLPSIPTWNGSKEGELAHTQGHSSALGRQLRVGGSWASLGK